MTADQMPELKENNPLIEIICRRLHSQAYCNDKVDDQWQDFEDDAKEILADIQSFTPPKSQGVEVAEAVRYFTQERIDLLNRVGFSGAVPFLETLIQSATRQPVENKPVEQEEFIEKTGYVDIYDKIIASGFIITRKD